MSEKEYHKRRSDLVQECYKNKNVSEYYSNMLRNYRQKGGMILSRNMIWSLVSQSQVEQNLARNYRNSCEILGKIKGEIRYYPAFTETETNIIKLSDQLSEKCKNNFPSSY